MESVELVHSGSGTTALRKGFRSRLGENVNGHELVAIVAGQIPYFYRQPDKIAADFKARHDAIEMIYDLAIKVPTSEKFQTSHFGEILSALYLESVLHLKRLYCKLTLLSSENTNAHKMDGLFVDTSTNPFSFFAVEAKTSILPTSATPFKGHRFGILKQMVASLHGYTEEDKRFDFVAIRDSLENHFTESEAAQIRKDLIPPGPLLSYIGMASINEATVCSEDDSFILTEPCQRDFVFHSITVIDLAIAAKKSFEQVLKLKQVKS